MPFNRCYECNTKFETSHDLRVHREETSHGSCQACNLFFKKRAHHIRHVRQVSHDEEYQCCDCNRKYLDQKTLAIHCCVCDKIYRTGKSLTKHLASEKHDLRQKGGSSSAPYLDGRHKCSECRKTFDYKQELTKHKKSAHKPKRTISCPIGRKCEKKFASASALLNHLESGGCKAGMNRETLNQFIIQYDEERHITCAPEQILLEAQEPEPASLGSDTSSWQNDTPADSWVLLTPTSKSDEGSLYSLINYSTEAPDDEDIESIGGVILTPSTGCVSPLISSMDHLHITPDVRIPDLDRKDPLSMDLFPTQNLRCNLCPPDRPPFGSMRAFQAHVNSPVHAPKIFKCPTAFVSGVKTPKSAKERKTFFYSERPCETS